MVRFDSARARGYTITVAIGLPALPPAPLSFTFNCYSPGRHLRALGSFTLSFPPSTLHPQLLIFRAAPANTLLPHRKASAPKAWSSGTNPITQRLTNPTLSNGASGAGKGSAGAKGMAASSKESSASDNNKHAHDRMVFLISNFVVSEPGFAPRCAVNSRTAPFCERSGIRRRKFSFTLPCLYQLLPVTLTAWL